MYLSFYGLAKKPFHITPDPEFLFLSPSHKEALGTILYGVEHRKGFVSITGEVGMGKTTVVRDFIDKYDRDRMRLVYIFNTGIDFAALLRMLIEDLAPESRKLDSADEGELLDALHGVLIEEYRAGRTVVLVIDDAQTMPVQTLERLRLLSNLETNTDKLLQLILIGQPELEEKLDTPELRQLRQRIAVRAVIKPLTSRESKEYIQHRLALAGGKGAAIFSPGTLKAIARYARGAPRLLNIICDNAMIAGYAEQQRSISNQLVRRVIRDYEQRAAPRLVWNRPAVIAAGMLLALLTGAVLTTQLTRQGPSRTTEAGQAEEQATQTAEAVPEQAMTLATARALASPMASEEAGRPDAEAGNASPRVVDAQPARIVTPPASAIVPSASVGVEAAESLTEDTRLTVAEQFSHETAPSQAEDAARRSRRIRQFPVADAVASSGNEIAVSAKSTATEMKESPVDPEVSEQTFTVEVLYGDCLSMILNDHYEKTSQELLDKVRQLNPDIENINNIFPGDRLVLPVDEYFHDIEGGKKRFVQAASD